MGRKKVFEIGGTNVRRRKDWGKEVFKDAEISEREQTTFSSNNGEGALFLEPLAGADLHDSRVPGINRRRRDD